LWVDTFKFSKKDIIIRLVVNVVDVNVLKDAFFIDDEDSSLRAAIFSEYTVFLGDFTVGPEIGKKWVRDSTNAFSPSF
jgi:hypothetical protein